ncbi:MAG TPA: arabinofuranosidase catalytic domain-containing protein [Polyangia bacterium]|nr:arabinofuranosidase catalytic domain-containing protein [Polyangia bacterium]
MTHRLSLRILLMSVWLGGAACSSSMGGSGGEGGNAATGTGGTSSTGTGGTASTGTGGTPTTGTGGTPPGTGGTVATGGVTASGGRNGGGGGGPTGAAGISGAAGRSATGGSTASSGMKPCDIYAAANTPCVAAFSTVRVLVSAYKGPLYQVRKGGMNNVFNGKQPIGTGGGTTGGTMQDISATADGFADSAAQDAFCGSEMCTVSKLYDQSGKGNDLIQAPAGQYEPGPDYEVPATHSVMVGGHKVYSLYFPNPPMLPSGSAPSGYGYRNNKTMGMPTGSSGAQGVYMVADGTHSGNGCCFDFGNAETNNGAGPTGAMAALNLGTNYWGQGNGSSPWFEGDFEAGVWAGGSSCGTPGSGQLTCSGRKPNPQNPSMKGIPFAFGILNTGTMNSMPEWVLKAADATKGTLTTAYNGVAPGKWALQGAVLLGTGGDNSNSSWGTFYEGAITSGQPSDATDEAIYANVVAVGYGK